MKWVMSFFLSDLSTATKASLTSIECHASLLFPMVDAQLQRRGDWGGRSPLPFLENQNNCPDFGDCVNLRVKFSIQNAVLTLSRREKSKILRCGAYFSCVFSTKCLLKCPSPTKPDLPRKMSGCGPEWVYLKHT